MSSVDNIRENIARCRQDFDAISKKLPALVEKMEALCLPKKLTELAKEKAELDTMMLRYKDLEANLRALLKALGKREHEAGTSSQAAATPAAKNE